MTSLPRLFSKGVLSIFVSTSVLFGGAGQSLAQTTPTTVPQSTVVLATVNIRDAKIVSQDGNTIHISFSLSNREGVQMGVRYGVQLVSETKNGLVIVDEVVYPDTLDLEENSNILKEITYTAPPSLSGAYSLFLISKNDSGFPLGIAFTGKITLTATVKGIEINPTSCFLQVAGEKGSPHYDLIQGVDIAQNENLILSCSVTNSGSVRLSSSPVFETRYRTAYGNVAPQTGGDTAPISFAPGEKKTISLTLPKAGEPQAYNISTTLKSGGVSSNTITARYVIRGASATIQNISLNKNFYKKGDTAVLSFIWTPSADAFPNSRIGTSSPSAVFANITMTDGSGNACISPTKEPLPGNMTSSISLPVGLDCSNPRLSLSLTDMEGKVLARKELAMTSPEVPQPLPSTSKSIPLILILGVVGVLAVLGGGVYFLMRKKEVIQQLP